MPRKKTIVNEEKPELPIEDDFDEQKPEELVVDDFFEAIDDEFYGNEAWIVDEDDENQEE